MRIGPYDVVSIQTGRFALDGGAMFGVGDDGVTRVQDACPSLCEANGCPVVDCEDDPAWLGIEEPDARGFCGLTCAALVLAECVPYSFKEEGFREGKSLF